MSASVSGGVAYERPDTLERARELLAEHGPDARPVAGGQTLSLLLRQGLLDADVLVDVGELDGLAAVETADGSLSVGAATTYGRLVDHPIATRRSVLEEAVSVIGDRQVRNMGTVGGALAHADPALDLPPALLCLYASVRIGSVEGTRTVPLDEFFRGYMTTDLGETELLEAVRIPAAGDDMLDRTGGAYEKHAAIKGGWATVGVASAVTLSPDGDRFEDVAVGVAAVADTAVRSDAVESALTGATVERMSVETASERVVEDIDPLDDLSGSAEYKRSVAPVIARRSLWRATERAGGER